MGTIRLWGRAAVAGVTIGCKAVFTKVDLIFQQDRSA